MDDIESTDQRKLKHEETHRNSSFLMKPWDVWLKICISINRFFEKIFFRWAGIAGTHPKAIIISVLLLSLALMAGFVRYNIQNHGEKLYFPQNSESAQNDDRAESSFPNKALPETFILEMEDKSSILTTKALKTALMLHNDILEKTGYNFICTRIRNDSTVHGCFYESVLELFLYNASRITNTSIQPTLINALRNDTILMSNGKPASFGMKELLGNFNYDNGIIFGTSLRMRYFVRHPDTDVKYDENGDVEKEFIDYLESKVSKLNENGLILYINAVRSIDDEIEESSGGDVKYVVVSILLMNVFTSLALAKFRDAVGGHLQVGMVGIICIMLGIGAAFGFVMATGVYYVAFVGTIPFLIVGVGIDDMFIIIDALDHVTPEKHGLLRLQTALGHVGASITMTTMTDLVAFAVSASSVFPAIRYFCVFAALSVLFSYFMLLTLMVAVLSLDVKRIEAGKMDMIPCKNVKNYEAWKESRKGTAAKIMTGWAKFLMKVPVRMVVVFSAFALLGVSVYGALKVEQRFDLKELSWEGSDFNKFHDANLAYPTGFSINIILDDPNFDYTEYTNQQKYNNITMICAENEHMIPDQTINWMSNFLVSSYCNGNKSSQCIGPGFYTNLSEFLKKQPMHYADIKWNGSIIQASKIICREKNNPSWTWKTQSMVDFRKDLDEKANIRGLFAVNQEYFFREQVIIVDSETIKNLLICGAAIFVITAPYLIHPGVLLLVCIGFAALVVELFALMAVWGVALNSISMIITIMAIGFAVDYSAHVAHAYIISNAPTPEERSIHALGSIGSSVLMGGTSTFLGIVIMAVGKSEVFRIFFKMMSGIVIIGLINGLILLPVFLSIFCRTNIKVSFIDDTPVEEISMSDNTSKSMTSDEKSEDNPSPEIEKPAHNGGV